LGAFAGSYIPDPPALDGDEEAAAHDHGDPKPREQIGKLAENDESEPGCRQDGGVLEGGDENAAAFLKEAINNPWPSIAQRTNPPISGASLCLGGTHTKGTAKESRIAPTRTEWASMTTAGSPIASFRLKM